MIIPNLKSQAVELVRWPETLVKILYFNGDQKFFQNSVRIKPLCGRGTKLFHLLAGEIYFGTGETISAKLLTGEATRAHLTEARGQNVLLNHLIIWRLIQANVISVRKCCVRKYCVFVMLVILINKKISIAYVSDAFIAKIHCHGVVVVFFLLKIILSYLSNKITKHRSTSFVFYKQLGFLVQSGVA